MMIWKLFNNKNKKNFFLIIFFMIIGAFLDAASVGLVFPILNFITNIDNYNSQLLNILFSFFSLENNNEKILFISFLFLLIFLFKAIFLTYLAWASLKFSFNFEVEICSRLFKHYIQLDLLDFRRVSSSRIIQNIIKEVNILVFNYLIPFLRFITELIVILILGTLLLYLEPIIAIFVLLLCFFFIVIYYYYVGRKLVPKWGNLRLINDNERTKKVREAFQNFKLIKILKLSNYYQSLFDIYNSNIAKYNRYHQTTVSLPTIFLELVAVMCLVLVIFVIVLFDRDYSAIIPITGLFAASAFRLIPAANRALSAIQTMKFAKPSLNIVYKEFEKNSFIENKYKKSNYIEFKKISFENVSFGYERDNLILNNISFEINTGDAIGIVGESGSGKSTIADIIMGLIKPTKGKVKFNDNDDCNFKIGYVPQNVLLNEDTIMENIAFGKKLDEINIEKIYEVIEKSQLHTLIKSLKNGIKTKVSDMGSNLSAGQIQRISIARTLYFDPDIIVFDEPTSSLDSYNEQKIIDELFQIKSNKTFILISHKKDTLKNCNKIIQIKNKSAKFIDI